VSQVRTFLYVADLSDIKIVVAHGPHTNPNDAQTMLYHSEGLVEALTESTTPTYASTYSKASDQAAPNLEYMSLDWQPSDVSCAFEDVEAFQWDRNPTFIFETTIPESENWVSFPVAETSVLPRFPST
jgi:hypothetical protein